jgi:hypothetical protein
MKPWAVPETISSSTPQSSFPAPSCYDSCGCAEPGLPRRPAGSCSTESLVSDGAFLTHFLLLVYEIATAGSEDLNLRAQYLG